MSFDLYFLSRGPGESWDEAMDALENAAGEDASLDDQRLATWARIRAAQTLGRVHQSLPSIVEDHQAPPEDATAG